MDHRLMICASSATRRGIGKCTVDSIIIGLTNAVLELLDAQEAEAMAEDTRKFVVDYFVPF
jgi:hypothetical protein